MDEFDYGARGYYSTIMRFGTIDAKAEKYYSYSPYAYCLNNPVKNIDPNGMDVWSTTNPEEIRRAMEAMMNGRDFGFNDRWYHRSDSEFNSPYGGGYSIGLNYNSKTGQLWLLSGGGINDTFVSQLTWVADVGYVEHAVGTEIPENIFSGFVGSRSWNNIGHGLNGASFVTGGMSHSVSNALNRTFAYTYSNSIIKPPQVMFKLPTGNMYLPTGLVRGASTALRYGGYALGGAGVAITIVDMTSGNKGYVEGGLDMIMGVVGFIPPYGYIVSGAYFGGKYILERTNNDFWNNY